MSKSKLPPIITLIGHANAGKSYWAQELEQTYGYKRFSIDEIIARALKLSSPQELTEWLGQPTDKNYFSKQNDYMHHEESALELITETLDFSAPTVIDTTGSVVFLSKTLLEKLAKNTTIVWIYDSSKSFDGMLIEYLREPKPLIWRNYFKGDMESSYKKLLDTRERLYNQWAHIKLDVTSLTSADEFALRLDKSKVWPYEFFLQQEILPLLEKGRPNWDRPHTESVVRHMKDIINEHTSLQVDPHVLIITSYIHDYGYSELYRGTKAKYEYDVMKRMHAKRSVNKWQSIQQESVFSFLTKEQKERITHLIGVHDDLEKISDIDERIIVEADTLGALETSLGEQGWQGARLKEYCKRVKKKRIPLFFNNSSKKKAKKIIKNLYNKIPWYQRMW